MSDELLTAEQLAARLGVKPRTVRTWMRAGLIPAARLTRKVVRYRISDVVAALEGHQKRSGVAK